MRRSVRRSRSGSRSAFLRLLKRETLTDDAFERVKAALLILSDQVQRTVPRELRDRDVATRLMAHTRRLLTIDPPKAVVVSELAVRIAERCEATTADEYDDVMMLQGNAWRWRAEALLRLGDYLRASEAVKHARTFYSMLGSAAVYEDALLAIASGQLRHFLGESDEGVAELERAAAMLLHFVGQKDDYLRARITLGTLLMRREQFREAIAVFDDASELAMSLQATFSHGAIVANVGYCAARLGDLDHAEACHNMAVAIFSDLGATSELPRVRGAWIEILIQRGRYSEALFQLQATKTEYLKLEMPTIAATFALDIVDLKLTMNKRVGLREMCFDLLRTFIEAGVHSEAARALKYLKELADNGALTSDEVRFVREFIRRLSVDDSLVFARPIAG